MEKEVCPLCGFRPLTYSEKNDEYYCSKCDTKIDGEEML